MIVHFMMNGLINNITNNIYITETLSLIKPACPKRKRDSADDDEDNDDVT